MPDILDHIKIKTEWDLTKLLPKEDAKLINAELATIQTLCRGFIDKWKARNDFVEDPLVLAEALTDLEKLADQGSTSGNVGYYFALKSSLFQDDPKIKAWENKIDEVAMHLSVDMEFFGLRISRIAPDLQPKFLQAPELAKYRHMLETSFANGKFMLSEAEEKILTLYSNVAFANWVKMTDEFVSTEEREALGEDGKVSTKNLSDLMNLLASSNIKVRESAASAINDIFAKHIKVGEAELNSVLANKKTSDNLRGFTRPDQSRHLSDDVKSEVVDVLLDVVSSNFDIVHKYYELKAKVLDLDKLRYFERNILYKGMDKTLSYNEASDLVYDTLNNLDTEFGEIYKKYLYEGQIDAFTKKGKNHGAFCAGGSKYQPGYVLLNYGNKLDDASTIAHEMGHAINDELVKKTCDSLSIDVPLCLAETASTFFEDFILDKIATTLEGEEKLAMMIYRLDSIMNTVFRQVACYRFEQDLHTEFRERGFLSKDEIGELFVKNMSAYCGPAIQIMPETPNWWLHWGHIRSFFYVYSYTFGFLISKNLQDLVRKDKGNISRIKKFLAAGSSKSPQDILMDLDIDISKKDFWENALVQIRTMLKECEDFAKSLGKA